MRVGQLLHAVICSLLALVIAPLSHSTVSLFVLEPSLVEGERLHVMLSVQDQHIDWTQVDLTPWLADFDVLETQVVERWHQQAPAGSDYHLWLAPLVSVPEGETIQVDLPALSYQDQVSNRASVRIASLAGSDIWMRPSRMATQARVNELHRYSGEVYINGTPDFRTRAAQVNGRSFSVSSQRQDDVSINGTTYQNYSLDFQLEPTNTGVLTIQWPSLSGNLISASTGWLRSVTLNVAPRQYQVVESSAPDNALVVDSAWLDVQLADVDNLRVGDSVSFTVTVNALGAAKEYLSALALAGQYDGYSIYQVSSARSEKRHGNGWLASLTTEYSLLVNEAGRLVLPAMSLNFYQPTTQRFETVFAPSLNNILARPQLPTFNVQAQVALNPTPAWVQPLVFIGLVVVLSAGAITWLWFWRLPGQRFARALDCANPETVWRTLNQRAQNDGVAPAQLIPSPDWPAQLILVQQAVVERRHLSVNQRRTLRRLAKTYRPPAAQPSPFI